MYKVDDVVVYGTEGVCKIEDITQKKFGKEIIEYYVLNPVRKNGSVVYVPVNNEKLMSRMRPILSKEEVKTLIALMPTEPTLWIANERERQKTYKDILLYGNSEDVIRLVRTLYNHQVSQLEVGKKLHLADERILKDAEKMLFDEFSYVFDIKPEEVLPFIMNQINITEE